MSAFIHLLLHQRQQTRSYLMRGAGAQDALLKFPWNVHPSYLSVSSSHGGKNSGEIRCAWSSVWRRLFVSTSASGEVQATERDWEEYFANPLQWWDNRFYKMNPSSLDFEHKVTKKVLWVDSCSTPPWVKAMPKLMTLGDEPSPGGYHTVILRRFYNQIVRLPKGNFARRETLPNQAAEAGGWSMCMRSANTTSEAIDLLKNRLQLGIATDSVTYIDILKRCLKREDLPLVKQVHECTIASGLQQNIYLANNLLSGFIRCGRLEDACRVFDQFLKKNVVSWNAMIGGYAKHNRAKDAMEVFNQMRQEGVQADAVTYLSILNACANPSALKWGEKVHSYIRHGGFESDVRVGTALLRMYAKCGRLDEARKTFENLASRNVISWNVMIGAYAERGCGEEAYHLLLRMKREGFRPTAITYLSILNAPANAAEVLELVRGIHSHACEEGLESDVRVGNALVHMYAKCESLEDARLAFDRMQEQNVITWNAMIGGVAKRGLGPEAFDLFLRMKREGFQPTAVTYVSLLNPCSTAGARALEWVRGVHNHAREAGLESNVRVGIALVRMYAKCGSLEDARLVFDRVEKRDVISWNVMIGAYGESGCGEEAYGLLLQMKREFLKPDAFTYSTILNACASAGALEWVREVHSLAREAGLELDLRVGNALVHMYGKCGSIEDARLAFDRMEDRDLVTWNVMIGGLAQHGCGSEALEVFRRMNAAGVKPNEYSFLALLSACSHAGLVEEGRRLFRAMSQDYGIVASLSHWTCMVDILGRAGHLKEAKLLIDTLPVEPDAATWGALLAACRSHNNMELGEVAAKERLKLEPKDASTYVLLSNIYAAAGKWEKVSLVRTAMQERGKRKDPGRSWIEVDNKIHAFVVGDTSHPESKEIYAELLRLTEKIKAEGYLPDTRLVLHDFDEKEKSFLCALMVRSWLLHMDLFTHQVVNLFMFTRIFGCA